MKLSLKKALFMFVVGCSLAKVSLGEELPAPVPEAHVAVQLAQNTMIASLEEEDFAGTPTPTPVPVPPGPLGGYCTPNSMNGGYIDFCAKTPNPGPGSVNCATIAANCGVNVKHSSCFCR